MTGAKHNFYVIGTHWNSLYEAIQCIPIPCVTENKNYFEVYTNQVSSHCHGFASFEHLKLQVSNKYKIALH